MVKICITKTSDLNYHNIKEYENLETCVSELLALDVFGKYRPELVISKPDDWMPKDATDCDYVVEIYDTWRE